MEATNPHKNSDKTETNNYFFGLSTLNGKII